jgi:predicted transcriptional regulator
MQPKGPDLENQMIINFRAPSDLVERLDELAREDGRTRANFILTLLDRVTDPRRPQRVLETIISEFYDETKKRGDSPMSEWMRGQLHGAKWMVHAILGEDAKERALRAVRSKLRKPIPHIVPLAADGKRYGLDLDAG